MRYATSSRTIGIRLAAPWLISFLQTTVQIFLGDPLPPVQLQTGRLCVCPDVNFLVLRSLIAFGLPVLVSVIILFLTAMNMRHGSRDKKPRTGSGSGRTQGHLTVNDTIPNKWAYSDKLRVEKENSLSLENKNALSRTTEESVGFRPISLLLHFQGQAQRLICLITHARKRTSSLEWLYYVELSKDIDHNGIATS